MLFDWFKKSGPEVLPQFWENYLGRIKTTSYHKKTLISEARFVVFDTETTGLEVRKDQILSIGAVAVQQNQIDLEESFECYVHQSYTPEKEAVTVHGILPVDREDSLDEKEAVTRFVDYIGDSILIGHHVAFDVGMINQALKKIVKAKLQNKTLDTIALARRLNAPTAFTKPGEFSLDHLCRRFDIPLSDRHTAAGDAYITAILFLKLVSRMRSRGVHTLGDLLR